MKTNNDTKRFVRYQSAVNSILAKDRFRKPDIYEALKDEKKAFIGRVVSGLVREGYLAKAGAKANLSYFWLAKRGIFNAGQWIDRQVFTATVKRSPSFDRPRERLLKDGPSRLKISEHLAILIRSGLQGESAIQAGEKLAALFGNNLEKLSLHARGELKQVSKAIGGTAYCQVMAALELGKRMANQHQADLAVGQKIRNTADTLAYCREHFMRLAQEARQEEFHVVMLDGKHNVIRSEQITVGLLNESLAHPREVFKPAIRQSAASIILVHNHPNGDPTPSQDDKIITQEPKRAAEILGIRILDHVIVSKDKTFSMVEEKIF